jgi:glycosyltransferase involved in cell wall biosynthesis
MRQQKQSNALIGAAGVHFVVSELSRRGLIALPTTRNTAGIDVVVVNTNGTGHANLQVKTSGRKVRFWPIGKRYKELRGKRNYYVFVRYLKKENQFEVFLESAAEVTKQVQPRERKKAKKGTLGIGPCWHLPEEESERQLLRRNWLTFGSHLVDRRSPRR